MAQEDTSPLPRPAVRIGKYEIVAKIGQGAMGEVYKARDTVLDRFVAIKTMSGAALANPEMGQRFLREAQSAARLNHPNVVTLHEFGEDTGRFFMAMELIAGEDLSRTLRRRGLPTLDDKIAVMEQILAGVAYAHAAGVVHRDLKPSNIQVQPNGHIKVMDFGLARFGEAEMTRTGTVMGTPNYMSPEQVRGERTSPASDVFALGAVFYEILGGRRAFDADSMHAVLFKVLEAQPTPLAECDAEIPRVLVSFVAKALAKAPEMRFRDGAQMKEALDICRSVLEGALDEASALAAMGAEPTTILYSPVAAEATMMSGAPPTMAKTAVALPRRPRSYPPTFQSGSPGATLGAGTQSRVGSKPPTPLASSEAAAPTSLPGAPSAAAPSRAPVAMGVAVVAVMGLILAVVFLKRPDAPIAPRDDGQARMAFGAAVEAQLDSARRSLEFKDPEAAASAAEKALRFDPGNTEAQDIAKRARLSLQEVEGAATEARHQADAGNLDAASKALARVLEIMPKHPVAAELSTRLASRFKASADSAARDMNRAADAARRAGASSLRAYAEATRHASAADLAYGKKQYTEATQRFVEAQRSYEMAAKDAQDLASKRTAAITAPTVAPPQAPLAPTPPPVASTPHLTPPPAPAPVVTTPAPALATPAPNPVRDDDAAVRRVITDLKRAIEEKDLALYKKVRPGLTADEERRLRDAFQNVTSQQVDYTINGVTIEGDRATLRVTRAGRVSGYAVPSVRQVLRLARTESGWVIVEIGQ